MYILYIYFLLIADEMDKNDDELRESIKKLWPIQGVKRAFMLVPPNSGKFLYSTYILQLF